MRNKRPNNTEVFSWSGLDLYQDEQVHKIGTDAILLGTWIPTIINLPGSILDVGTGTGILALMMAKEYQGASVQAVDVDDKALELASKNIALSAFSDRISIVVEDVIKFGSNKPKFDLVISNPPFYNTHNPSKSEHKKLAKHSSVPVDQWMFGILGRVDHNGHCCIIVPTNSAEDWIRAANEKKYYNTNRLDVYSFADDQRAVRSLLHFSDQLLKPHFTQLILYNKDNTYTAQYLKFSGIAKDGGE